MTLTSLYNHCVLHSSERLETHSLVANELSDHYLRWKGGAVDTRLCKFRAQQLSLYSLRYGDAVAIYPEVYRGFSLVHFSLAGGIEVEADGVRQPLRQGHAVISSPGKNISLNWHDECEQLILRVPHELMDAAACKLGQPHLSGSVRSNPGLLLSPAASHQWQLHLQTFMALEGYAQQNEAYAPWLAHMEQGLAMFLMLQGDAATRLSAQTHDGHCGTPGSMIAKRRLERLQEYARSHLTEPVALADMARAAALSERHLNALCHRHLGEAPMTWLRALRLDAIRDALRSNPDVDIAATAMLHGFSHVGRFASYYRMRFGELPSQTLKSAKSG